MNGIDNFFKNLGKKEKPAEKQDSPQKPTEQRVTDEYKSDVANFISFIVKEDKENNIILGRNKGGCEKTVQANKEDFYSD